MRATFLLTLCWCTWFAFGAIRMYGLNAFPEVNVELALEAPMFTSTSQQLRRSSAHNFTIEVRFNQSLHGYFCPLACWTAFSFPSKLSHVHRFLFLGAPYNTPRRPVDNVLHNARRVCEQWSRGVRCHFVVVLLSLFFLLFFLVLFSIGAEVGSAGARKLTHVATLLLCVLTVVVLGLV